MITNVFGVTEKAKTKRESFKGSAFKNKDF